RIVGEAGDAARLLRNLRTRKNGDAVVGLLPAVGDAIAGRLDLGEREIPVLGLGFLQAGDVGPGSRQPVEQMRQPDLERVDVPGRQPQRHAAIMPLCLSSASTLGSRPRNARNDSAAGRLPPTARISSRKRAPALASRIPLSSKKL